MSGWPELALLKVEDVAAFAILVKEDGRNTVLHSTGDVIILHGVV
jgi:hypothetical protein